MRNWISLKLPSDVTTWLSSETINLKKFISNCNSQSNLDFKLDFDPMLLEDLHLTLIFCGSYFKNLDKNQISKVNSILHDFELIIFELSFDRFELFPPGKENLIIAKFKLDFNTLRAVTTLKSKLYKVLNMKEEISELIPHITLGKIKFYNPQKYSVDLNKYQSTLIVPQFETSGTYICGTPISYIKY
jgi:2'-5' RNA ligase